MKKRTKIVLWVLGILILLGGLGYWLLIQIIVASVGGWGYGIPQGSSGELPDLRVVRTNTPPQVIYRIDNERFLTLENYISCDLGGTIYFNNTALGIKTKVAGSDDMNSRLSANDILGYRGVIVHLSTANGLVFPDAPKGFCSNNGCDMGWYKSFDGGRSFDYISKERTHNPSGISRKYEVLVGDGFYWVRDYFSDVIKYSSGEGGYYERVRSIPGELLNNPQGDTRYHCDSNIKPDKIEYIEPERKPVRSTRTTG